MAVLGKVTVQLTARTTAFAAGMKRAQGILRRFRAGVSTAMRILKRMGTVAIAAGLAAATAFVWWQKTIFATIDAQAKLARSLGMTLAGFRALAHAAELAGANEAALAKALQMMNKNLGEAAQGFGLSVKWLKVMGIETADLLALSPEEQFAKLADEINALPKPADRAAAAMGIFGGAAKKIINLLAIGSKGIEENRREFRKLGREITFLDAAAIEEANDAVTRLGKVVSIAGATIASDLAPYVKALADEITDVGVAAQDSFAEKTIGAVKWVAEAVAVLIDAFSVLKTIVYGLGTFAMLVFNVIVAGVTGAAQAVGWFVKTITLGVVDISAEVGVLEEFQQDRLRDLDLLWEGTKDTYKSIGDAAEAHARRMARIDAAAIAARGMAAAKARMDEAAAAAGAGAGAGVPPPGAPTTTGAAARIGEFGVGPIRYSVSGLSKAKPAVQEIHSAQLESIALLLGIINRTLTGGMGAL